MPIDHPTMIHSYYLCGGDLSHVHAIRNLEVSAVKCDEYIDHICCCGAAQVVWGKKAGVNGLHIR